jgi:hypothetical protein
MRLVAVTFAVSIAAASAQTTTVPPGSGPVPSAFAPDPIIQITTTFRARIEGQADPRDVPAPTAQDTARRVLYNMAANECSVLAEYWKAECRLSAFDISIATGLGPEVPPSAPSMFGTAIYELRLTPPGR